MLKIQFSKHLQMKQRPWVKIAIIVINILLTPIFGSHIQAQKVKQKTDKDFRIPVDTSNHAQVLDAYVFTLFEKCWSNRAKTIALVKKHMIIEINIIRAAHSLSKVSINPILQKVAQDHADDMLANKFYNHTNKQGENRYTRAHKAGLKEEYLVENIDKWSLSIQQVINEMRMQSKWHKRNILERYVTDIGVWVCFWELHDISSIHWVLIHAKIPNY